MVDCATEFAHQFFRGTCDTATGACTPVDGKKTKKTGEICDLNGDCETEKCAGGQLAMNQDKLSVCSTACVNEVTGALDDAKCNVGICGLYGICTVECTADEECPLSAATDPPPAGKAWSYLPCKAGRCTRP